RAEANHPTGARRAAPKPAGGNPMVDVSFDREPALPRGAATVIVVRDPSDGGAMEIFCVERNNKSAFFGGAIVFPGGKLDEADRDAGWETAATEPALAAHALASDTSALR